MNQCVARFSLERGRAVGDTSNVKEIGGTQKEGSSILREAQKTDKASQRLGQKIFYTDN
jgi:hypothetical protein